MSADELAAELIAAIADARIDVELSAVRQRRVSLRLVDSAVSEANDTIVTRVRARAAVGTQVASVVIGASDRASVHAAIDEAITRAHRAPPQAYFDGFADAVTPGRASTRGDDPIAIVHEVRDEARATGARISGVIDTTTSARAVVTTRGARAHADAHAVAIALQAGLADDPATARDSAVAESAPPLDVRARARALATAVTTHRAATAIAAGVYDVVLGPSAVAELLEWLALIGLGGRAVLDGESFLGSLDGSTAWLSLADDPAAFGALGSAFDSEGTPTPKRELIVAGRAVGCVHDRRTAAEASARAAPFGIVSSTGHAVPLDDQSGDDSPIPRHLVMSCGALDDAALLAGIDDGLYVPHLHYVNGLLDPPRAVMTGLTRHGLRRITRGQLGAPVTDLRFTESMVAALARVDGVGSLAATMRGSLGLVRCPSLRLRALALG